MLSMAMLVLWTADSLNAADDKKPSSKAAVPLKKIVLYNAGVGFFEHRGEVTGNTNLDLQFKVNNINDLLKSMVVQDRDGGQISAISYGSRDPVTKALKSFAIDLTKNPTLSQLLAQVRGEQVEIEAPQKITGVILGVETRKKHVDKELIEVQVLNLLTETGLRSVSLDTVGRIQLLNPKLDAELRQALQILALGHDTDKKTVTLNFTGAGKRMVNVGYIQETPVWKTSYRLVLSNEGTPMLQGWAIVENTTEQDWTDVGLSLVSGRPITFTQDLYQPLYVQRPVVQPELYSSLTPRVYDQDMAAADKEFRNLAENRTVPQMAPGKGFGGGSRSGRQMGQMLRRPASGRTQNNGEETGILPEAEALSVSESQLNLQSGVASAAQGGATGEFFQYEIKNPVSLQRQRSAMLPIVNEKVSGEKVSIYNVSVNAKHPLHGLKFKNSTKLHLMQGPITVFDDNAYAGDAQIEDLPPGTERLLSYAMDLDTEVAPQGAPQTEQLVKVIIVRGTLNAERKYHRVHTYIVKNSGKRAKKVLIEQLADPQWKLVDPKEPAEKTRNMYRFAVTAEPGKPAKLEIHEELTANQTMYLTNVDPGIIQFFLSAKVVSEKIKQSLREVNRRNQESLALGIQRSRLQQQIAVITEEQNRIRQNMAQLDRTTELYLKYVKKFGVQEEQNDKLREDIQKMTEKEDELRKSLQDYLTSLTEQ